jgi:serine protein kinase
MGSRNSTLEEHIDEVKQGNRKFENAFQAISRMILEQPIETVSINGHTTYDFQIFRTGKKHSIGMYQEINSLVSFIKDAAEGGSSKEMAFALVGEPGNGKTFLVEYLCDKYRDFLSADPNRRFTFRFNNLQELGTYGKISRIESQTFEDPMILAMNLFDGQKENIKFLEEKGFSEKEIERFFDNYRPLGADSFYILNEIRELTDGDVSRMLDFIDIISVPLSETLGTVTGKYSAKDKITSSSVDLLGEESIQRLLHLSDPNNPYRFDLRRGALARVAGGGIHFGDEIFKNKVDLIQIYLGVVQNRTIELDGFKWPLDSFIVFTSNNSEFNKFRSEGEHHPITDRCRVTFMSHNTDYKLQQILTGYSLGEKEKTTFSNDSLHRDPNLNYGLSVAVVLSRLPIVQNEKLTPVEMLKLAAGEVAADKSIKALAEIIDDLNHETDITKRFGQKGIGHRQLGRALQVLLEKSETNQGRCMYAGDVFRALEQVVLDDVVNADDRTKYLKDLGIGKELYRERIMTEMFNAYMDDPDAVRKDVMNYVNMIIGIDSSDVAGDKMWKYRDPQTKQLKAIKIDERYIKSVEDRMGATSMEQKESVRTEIRKIYGQKIQSEPGYDFMDNVRLVKAVTEVRVRSDIEGAGSLMGALANRTNESNQKLYLRIINTMTDKLGYCSTCAEKTIEYFCTHDNA